jgi:hypothetical protein
MLSVEDDDNGLKQCKCDDDRSVRTIGDDISSIFELLITVSS